jgi:hypothetical protein
MLELLEICILSLADEQREFDGDVSTGFDR